MDIFDSLFIFIFHFVHLFWPFIFDIVIDLCMNYNGFFFIIYFIYIIYGLVSSIAYVILFENMHNSRVVLVI